MELRLPVLLQEVLEWMDVKENGVYADGTLGGGGHSGAMLKDSGGTARLYGIDRNKFLQALSTVRGNQRVVSDNPEATYDTLNKYGADLVERAREQKLDPVIGRVIRQMFRLSFHKIRAHLLLFDFLQPLRLQ